MAGVRKGSTAKGQRGKILLGDLAKRCHATGTSPRHPLTETERYAAYLEGRGRFTADCVAACLRNGQMRFEFARNEDTVLLRDSKDPLSPVLSFRVQEIQAFFDGVKAGDLDDLL